MKACKALRLGCEKIKKIPLRHEGDKPAARRQVGKIGDGVQALADLRADRTHLAVRQLQERVQQPEFVHHLQGGWVHRVAAEVAQEIAMLLQHDDIDAGAREQQAEHHAGGTATGDAAAGRDRGHAGILRRWRVSHAAQPFPVIPAQSGNPYVDGPRLARTKID